MNGTAKQANAWVWLSLPITVLLVVAAGCEVFLSGLYRDAPSFAAQARGQDIFSLFVVVPTFVISAFLAGRGSLRARLVWLGVLINLVYTYVIAAFDVRFNPLFLVYVALLGCSLYGLIGGLGTANMTTIKASLTEKAPIRVVSVFLAALAALFYPPWLNEVVPALMTGQIPPSVQNDGTPTNAVHVLDMAWILPAFGITAVSLWRRQALGYTLARPILTFVVLLALAILSMVVFMARQGLPVAAPQVVVFGALFATSLVLLVWYMRASQSPR